MTALSLDAMTKWLDAIAADPAPLNFPGTGGYNTLYPMHWEPRLVAGAPLTNDVIKCQLKAIKMTDYKVAFSAEQQARLKRIFPQGVCDFTKPSVGYVKFGGPWQRY